MKQPVTINARKLDGRIHRSWRAELISENEDFWLFIGEFENEISHPELGVIRRGTISYEYYWKNRWFNVFRFHEPEGALRKFYCNVNQPPKFERGVLDYVDLDIDVLVRKDFSFKILDLEEFAENSKIYGYSDELTSECMRSLEELKEMINRRDFPFQENFG
jgi:Uncharacterized domain/protein associated with RNAses G and E